MTIHFQTDLWTETWRVSWLNAKYVLLYVAAMFLLAVLLEVSGKDKPQWVAQVLIAPALAIPASLTVLCNRPGFDDTAIDRYWGVTLRGGFIWLSSYLLYLQLFILLVKSFTPLLFLIVLAKPFFWLLLGSAAYAMLGTVLPAFVTGQDRSFHTAWKRGFHTCGFAFPRLLVSLGVLAFSSHAAVYGVMTVSNSGGKFVVSEGGVDVPMILANVTSNLIGAVGLVMTAVILSRAFLMAEGKTSLVQE